MVACVCTAKSYVALTRFGAASNAVLASPTFWVTSSLATGRLRHSSNTFACSGSGVPPVHVTRTAFAALIAPHSLRATTARKSPLRTVWMKPLTCRAAESSTDAMRAPLSSGRMTRACSIPGTRTSWM